MKKVKILTGLTLCGMVLSTGVMMSFADVKETPTDGFIEFKTGGDDMTGEITKPDTEDEFITPNPEEGGNSTKGPLRLSYVPAFNFGTQDISSDTKNYQAVMLHFRAADLKDPVDYADKLPHFIQVVDERGENLQWKVNISQSVFTPDAASVAKGAKPLANTKVIFTEKKLFNTNNQAGIDTLVEGFATDTLSLEPGGASSELVKTKVGQTTNGSKTSLVFNNAYTAATPITAEKNSGVTLEVPKSDVKMDKAKYTAQLIWTLSDTL